VRLQETSLAFCVNVELFQHLRNEKRPKLIFKLFRAHKKHSQNDFWISVCHVPSLVRNNCSFFRLQPYQPNTDCSFTIRTPAGRPTTIHITYIDIHVYVSIKRIEVQMPCANLAANSPLPQSCFCVTLDRTEYVKGDSTFSVHYPRFMSIGEDRHKDRSSFAVYESSRFVTTKR